MNNFVKTLSRPWKRAILLGIDLILVPISLLLAYTLQANAVWPDFPLVRGLGLAPLLMVIAGIISTQLGIPDIKLNAYETRAVFKSGIFALLTGIAGVFLNISFELGFQTSVFAVFAFVFFSLCVASRLIGLRLLLWIYQKDQKRTRLLIYGAGATGVQLVAATTQSEEVEPVAFVDDNTTLQGIMVAGLPVYSPVRIKELTTSLQIDRVVLAMPSLSHPRQSQVAWHLQKLGCEVHRIPSFSELVGNRDLVANLEPVQPADFLGREKLDGKLPKSSATYRDKNILVSGAGGSVGSELCRQLVSCKPKKIVLFEQSEANLYTIGMELEALAESAGVEIVPIMGSVTDRIRDETVFATQNIDVVLHAAAYKHVPLVETNELEGLRNNVLGTRTLAEAARQAEVGHFVLVSTDKAVRPTNVMGASKRMAELVIQDLATRAKKTRFSMVRFGNVLGSSGSVIPLFQEQIQRGGPVTVTHDNVTRFFMTVSEAARLVLIAGSFSRGGDVFVLDMGEPVKIFDLACQMIERSGYSVRDEKNPEGDIEIVTIGLRPGEKLYEELLIGDEMQTTPHKKILRAQENRLSELEVATMIRDLNAAIVASDDLAARELVRRCVEGYFPADLQASI